MTCPNYIKVAYAHTGPKTALVTRLRCKRWSCEYCAEKNRKIWQYWLIERMPQVSERWWLITLTANENLRGRVESLQNIRTNLDALFKRVRRVWPDFQYGRVFEKHPTSDAAHVHIVACGLSPYVARTVNRNGTERFKPLEVRTGYRGTWAIKTWFKRNARDLGMGYQADVQAPRGDAAAAAWYLTKYLTKDAQAIDMPYLRHVQVSQGIGTPQFEAKYQWTPASYIVATMFEPNAQITDLDTGNVIDNNYWEHTGFWPSD